VEVALLIALVAIAVTGALRAVGASSNDQLDTAGRGIHEGGADERDDDPSSGGSGGGGSNGGDGPDPLPTPTSPPTSAPAPTSPTTTSAPPPPPPPTTTTTTTPQPAVGAASLHSGSTSATHSSWWATATLDLVDQGGQPLIGAEVTVRLRTRVVSRWGFAYYEESSMTAALGNDGSVELDVGPYPRSGGGRVLEVRYTVEDVDVPGPGSWDGEAPSLTVGAP
jgi:hypothetical protein